MPATPAKELTPDFVYSRARNRAGGILLDTNALLLYLLPLEMSVGDWSVVSHDRAAIHRSIILGMMELAAPTTTPHILTEADYFIRERSGPLRERIQRRFMRFVDLTGERWRRGRDIVRLPGIRDFGIADLGLAFRGRKPPLIVTEDAKLASTLESREHEVINLRSIDPLDVDADRR